TSFFNTRGAPTQRISKRNSTNNASWGGAPTERNRITNSNRQCKLAGPQHREIGSPISTDNASWGGAQLALSVEKSAYKNVQVGGAPT
ncbi:TPA: hypothetical protein ACSPBP_002729, partial [Staphylococcus aureus]